jgi:CDP-paratose 2-epimerase
VLVTGGAGFVGGSLAVSLKAAHAGWQVTALDNLKRRGSELGLSRLSRGGVTFVHGDVRVPSDLELAGGCDVLIECSAEPSVLAALDPGPLYTLHTNLGGTINCLEYARRVRAAVIFLSTSRVYPVRGLSALPLREAETRFELSLGATAVAGLSEHGVAEDFPLSGSRSFYGASKLASELLIAEYVEAFGMPAVVDRCGVIAGPWQMGRVDQGIVMHWAASHLFGWPLRYIGYGGAGKQVRDLLHVDDLADLIELQIARLDSIRGATYNIGGGRAVSVSLRELTELCRREGKETEIASVADTRPFDVPLYLSDSRRAAADLGWAPARSASDIVRDCFGWLAEHGEDFRRSSGH